MSTKILPNEKGQALLLNEIINQGLCVQCGACVGHCPYFDFFDGRITAMDTCRSDTGRCIDLCPQIEDEDVLLEQSPRHPIGPFREILMAKAMEPSIRDQAQYGGIVSSILSYALKKGLIQSAVLTNRGEGSAPHGVIAESESDILACAGSRYSSSASLSALNRAIRENKEKIAVVGLPCQMKSLARMKSMDKETTGNRISLAIGLFCTWSISYRELNQHLIHEGISSNIIKCDIPPPPSQLFKVQTDEGWFELPLEEIRPYIHKGCARCLDMTAEYSDISVGTVEDKEGWNTVIARSDVGMELMDMARKDRIIETRELPKTNLEHLKKAAANKKARGLSARKNKELS
jgi:coenzyme F420 hydrogenase subunit beta